MVTHVAKEQSTFSSAIKCNACNAVIHLHQKDKSAKDNPYLISNWTRHVKTCKPLNSSQKFFHQSTISQFLPIQSNHDHASGPSTPLLDDMTSDTTSTRSDTSDEPYSNLTPPHFEEKKITPFPVLRERRSSLTARTICIKVYCHCWCIDTGEKMVICDKQCGEWFHTKCVDRAVSKKQRWFCKTCRVDWFIFVIIIIAS